MSLSKYFNIIIIIIIIDSPHILPSVPGGDGRRWKIKQQTAELKKSYQFVLSDELALGSQEWPVTSPSDPERELIAI
jgi:hypothetical protein